MVSALSNDRRDSKDRQHVNSMVAAIAEFVQSLALCARHAGLSTSVGTESLALVGPECPGETDVAQSQTQHASDALNTAIGNSRPR